MSQKKPRDPYYHSDNLATASRVIGDTIRRASGATNVTPQDLANWAAAVLALEQAREIADRRQTEYEQESEE